MSQNATLYIYNIENRSKTINLTFAAWTSELLKLPRTLDVYLNRNLVKSLELNGSYVVHKIKLDIVPGENKILFYSREGCISPTELGLWNDTRCLSFAFSRFSIK